MGKLTKCRDISRYLTGLVGYFELCRLRTRENGRHFAGDILKFIFLNENFILVGFNSTLVQAMTCRLIGGKSLTDPMLTY